MPTRLKKKTRSSRDLERVRKIMRRAVEVIRARQNKSAILQNYIARTDRKKRRRR